MFSQFGEVDDDVFYTEQVLTDNLAYAQAMLDQPISDYEKERWQAELSQSPNIIASDQPIENIESTLISDELDFEMAGFDLSSNWPMLAILGVGILVALRKGNGKVRHGKRSKRR